MSKIIDRIKKWLRVDEEIEDIRRQSSEEIAKLMTMLETAQKENAALKASQSSIAALSCFAQLAAQYRDEKATLTRKVGRPQKNREPFNTTIDADLKLLIRLLEQRGELKRGDVSNFINRSLREWLQTMLSIFDEGVSVVDDDGNDEHE